MVRSIEACTHRLVCLQDKCHPQTIAVCQTRAEGLGLKVLVGDEKSWDIDSNVCGVLLQYPATDGSIYDYKVCAPYSALHGLLAGCDDGQYRAAVLHRSLEAVESHMHVLHVARLKLRLPVPVHAASRHGL